MLPDECCPLWRRHGDASWKRCRHRYLFRPDGSTCGVVMSDLYAWRTCHTMAAMTVEQRFDAVLSAQQFMQLEPGVCFSAWDSPHELGMYKHPDMPAQGLRRAPDRCA